MKLRLIYFFFFFLAFAMVLLQSRSSGVGAMLGQDRTGSPLSVGTCASCHSGGLFGTTMSIAVKDGAGTTITTYVPGNTYTVEYTVASGSGFQYGMQGVALTTTNAQAGSFGTPTSTNTQVSTVSSREYLEHSAPATGAGTYTFTAPWTAPTSGTGNVTFYGIGMTVNGNLGTSGDDPSTTTTLVLNEGSVTTSIDYGAILFCANAADPTPTITGTQGGTFSATPSGLVINATTGEIDLDASTDSVSFIVQYTYATGSVLDTIGIIAADDASFGYAANAYCKGDSDPTPTVTGLTGGTFSGSTGLVVSSSTGAVDISASTTGTHVVSYTTNGNCPNTDTDTIMINALDNASFTYGGNSFCQNGNNATPTGGLPGGTWSSTSGLAINSSTGVIDVSASAVGSYMVTYTTAGPCPNADSSTITILSADSAGISYPSFTYCANATDPIATITGTTGGAFSAPFGLSINSTTGEIDLSASGTGTYTIAYNTNGTCADTDTTSITINPADNASFTYGGNSFCQNGNDATPTGGLPGGTWSSTSGLAINSSTGVIDVSASTAGSYMVTYTTAGQCPNADSSTINILQADTSYFAYSDTTICMGSTINPLIQATGAGAGSYSSSSAGLSINSNTGEVNLSTSTVGTYTVYYTNTANCGTTDSVTVHLSICSGLAKQAITNYQLQPNPSQGICTIRNNDLGGNVNVVVYDMLGAVVYRSTAYWEAKAFYPLNLSSLSEGIYTIQIQKEGETQNLRMLIQR